MKRTPKHPSYPPRYDMRYRGNHYNIFPAGIGNQQKSNAYNNPHVEGDYKREKPGSIHSRRCKRTEWKSHADNSESFKERDPFIYYVSSIHPNDEKNRHMYGRNLHEMIDEEVLNDRSNHFRYLDYEQREDHRDCEAYHNFSPIQSYLTNDTSIDTAELYSHIDEVLDSRQNIPKHSIRYDGLHTLRQSYHDRRQQQDYCEDYYPSSRSYFMNDHHHRVVDGLPSPRTQYRCQKESSDVQYNNSYSPKKSIHEKQHRDYSEHYHNGTTNRSNAIKNCYLNDATHSYRNHRRFPKESDSNHPQMNLKDDMMPQVISIETKGLKLDNDEVTIGSGRKHNGNDNILKTKPFIELQQEDASNNIVINSFGPEEQTIDITNMLRKVLDSSSLDFKDKEIFIQVRAINREGQLQFEPFLETDCTPKINDRNIQNSSENNDLNENKYINNIMKENVDECKLVTKCSQQNRLDEYSGEQVSMTLPHSEVEVENPKKINGNCEDKFAQITTEIHSLNVCNSVSENKDGLDNKALRKNDTIDTTDTDDSSNNIITRNTSDTTKLQEPMQLHDNLSNNQVYDPRIIENEGDSPANQQSDSLIIDSDEGELEENDLNKRADQGATDDDKDKISINSQGMQLTSHIAAVDENAMLSNNQENIIHQSNTAYLKRGNDQYDDAAADDDDVDSNHHASRGMQPVPLVNQVHDIYDDKDTVSNHIVLRGMQPIPRIDAKDQYDAATAVYIGSNRHAEYFKENIMKDTVVDQTKALNLNPNECPSILGNKINSDLACDDNAATISPPISLLNQIRKIQNKASQKCLGINTHANVAKVGSDTDVILNSTVPDKMKTRNIGISFIDQKPAMQQSMSKKMISNQCRDGRHQSARSTEIRRHYLNYSNQREVSIGQESITERLKRIQGKASAAKRDRQEYISNETISNRLKSVKLTETRASEMPQRSTSKRDSEQNNGLKASMSVSSLITTLFESEHDSSNMFERKCDNTSTKNKKRGIAFTGTNETLNNNIKGLLAASDVKKRELKGLSKSNGTNCDFAISVGKMSTRDFMQTDESDKQVTNIHGQISNRVILPENESQLDQLVNPNQIKSVCNQLNRMEKSRSNIFKRIKEVKDKSKRFSIDDNEVKFEKKVFEKKVSKMSIFDVCENPGMKRDDESECDDDSSKGDISEISFER